MENRDGFIISRDLVLLFFIFTHPTLFLYIYFSFALTAYLALSRTLCLHFLYTIPSLQLCLKSIPPPPPPTHTQFFPHDLAHEPYLTTHLVMIRINISGTCTNGCTRLFFHFSLQTPSTHSTLPTPLAPPLPTHPACPNPPPLFHTQR